MLPFKGYVVDNEDIVGVVLLKDGKYIGVVDSTLLRNTPWIEMQGNKAVAAPGSYGHVVITEKFLVGDDVDVCVTTWYSDSDTVKVYRTEKNLDGSLLITEYDMSYEQFGGARFSWGTKCKLQVCAGGNVTDIQALGNYSYRNLSEFKPATVMLSSKSFDSFEVYSQHCLTELIFDMELPYNLNAAVSIMLVKVEDNESSVTALAVTHSPVLSRVCNSVQGCAFTRMSEHFYEISASVHDFIYGILRKLINDGIGIYVTVGTGQSDNMNSSVTRIMATARSFLGLEVWAKQNDIEAQSYPARILSFKEKHNPTSIDWLNENIFEVTDESR